MRGAKYVLHYQSKYCFSWLGGSFEVKSNSPHRYLRRNSMHYSLSVYNRKEIIDSRLQFNVISKLVYRPQSTKTISLICQNPGKNKRKLKGATGIEPVTSRSAVECSTTELCPLAYNKAVKFLFLTRES